MNLSKTKIKENIFFDCLKLDCISIKVIADKIQKLPNTLDKISKTIKVIYSVKTFEKFSFNGIDLTIICYKNRKLSIFKLLIID